LNLAIRSDGATIWVHNETRTVYYDDNRKVAGMIGFALDITECKQVEELLQKSKDWSMGLFFRLLVDSR
jgi:PAS domain S-box-containing protein